MSRIFNHIRSVLSSKDEKPLLSEEILPLTDKILRAHNFSLVSERFLQEIKEFFQSTVNSLQKLERRFQLTKETRPDHVGFQILRVTESQVVTFLNTLQDKFLRAKM